VEPKLVAFAGYEPEGDAPVEIAVVEALARTSARYTMTANGRECSHREVRLLERFRAVVVIVACPEGARVGGYNVPLWTP
jgi:hypothetical protein